MTWGYPCTSRKTLLAIAVLVLLTSDPVLALPGDLEVTMDLSEGSLEAAPQEEADTVTFHGNVSFTQPFYQYAQASLTASMDRNWTVGVNPVTVSRRGGGVATFTVDVTVPTSARGGDVGLLYVVAEYSTRLGDPRSVEDSSRVSVASWYGYSVNVSGHVELSLIQGGAGKLRVPIRNLGNEPDSYSGDVPYWYGLRPMGLDVDVPASTLVKAKQEAVMEFPVTVGPTTVPRTYVFDLVVSSQYLPRGGEGPTTDPRAVEARVVVSGAPPPDDPYGSWELEDPLDVYPTWEQVFGQSAFRRNVDISPKGRHLTWDQASPGGERSIHLGEATGASSRQLTRGHVDHHPVFSPTSDRIAFSRAPDRIMVMDLNGTLLMEFGSTRGGINVTDWSPSGDRLLFDCAGNIYELDIGTNFTRSLAGEPVGQWGAVYSPDGGRVFYLSYEAAGLRCEVFSMGPDGSGHTQLTFNEEAEEAVAVSPNGKRLAFTTAGGDVRGHRLCVMAVDGTGGRYFTTSGRLLGSIVWHPEGRALLVEASGTNTSSPDIYRVAYPWDDAGVAGTDDGGSGAPIGGDLWEGLVDALGWSGIIVLVVIIAVVVAVSALAVRYRRRQRERVAAAERLKRMTGRAEEATTPQGRMIPPVEVIDERRREDRFVW